MTTEEKHRVMAIGLAKMPTDARAVAIKAALDAAHASGVITAKEACAVIVAEEGNLYAADLCRSVEVPS